MAGGATPTSSCLAMALVVTLGMWTSVLSANPLIPRIGMADPHMHVFPSNPDVVQLYSTHDCNKGRSGPCVREPSSGGEGSAVVGAAGEEHAPGFRMIDWWVWSSADLVSGILRPQVLSSRQSLRRCPALPRRSTGSWRRRCFRVPSSGTM
jgi:hypothetical protein